MDRYRSIIHTTDNMKGILAIATVITLGVSSADLYVEYKNELPIVPVIGKEVHHLRIGTTKSYKGLTMYVEGGGMSNGYSYETGYKYKIGQWTIKGKYENKNTSSVPFGVGKSKLQTEVRYTFKK